MYYGAHGVYMDASTALTTVVHKNRNKKPEAQLAEETGIAPSQIRKYRSGQDRPHVDEWPRIIRAIHEVDPAGAAILAAAALPVELFTPKPTSSDCSSLEKEIMEASAASGALSQTYLSAMEDDRIDSMEVEDLEKAYRRLAAEAEQGLAALEQYKGRKQCSRQ